MAKRHLQHIKSSQANKIPTAADLMYGEIAVNYANGSEQLFIKNSDDEIVPFVSGKVIEENEMAIAAGMAQLNENIEGITSSIEELSQTVEDNELVTAGALTQLNEDIENVTSSIENVESSIEELSQTVEDNELVTAGALTQLNDEIEAIKPSIQSIESDIQEINDSIDDNKPNWDNLENVTYGELVTKVNNEELVPGRYYKIINYNTTTSQEDTRSAGHDFCVIVLALSENKLSENAYATQKTGDTYFSDSNLSAWKLKYCLTNDTERFAWADSTNGKGVIYYMKDEWNNECPYDFKNIQFKRWAVTKTNASSDDPFNNRYVGINNDGEILPNGYDIPDDNDFKWLYTFSGQSASWDEESDSIIYPDDITRDTEIYDLSNVDMHGFYNETTDPVGCSNNIIKEYYGGRNFAVNTLTLNNIIFTGWFINVETLPSNYEELYGDGIFEMMSVPFSNTFENECYNNTFGNSCFSNTFGNYCGSNTFGNNTYGNTFGNYCGSNTFGNGCGSNTFGNECYNNSFGNSVNRNSFGNAVNHVTFSKDYTYYVIVENGNQYITLTSTATTSSSNLLRNITIAQGVNNTTTNKSISHNTVNDTIKTTYQPANSVVNNI